MSGASPIIYCLKGDQGDTKLSRWIDVFEVQSECFLDNIPIFVMIAHWGDEVAFHAFVDRFTAEASSETFDLPESHTEVEEVESLIRQKLEQLKMG